MCSQPQCSTVGSLYRILRCHGKVDFRMDCHHSNSWIRRQNIRSAQDLGGFQVNMKVKICSNTWATTDTRIRPTDWSAGVLLMNSFQNPKAAMIGDPRTPGPCQLLEWGKEAWGWKWPVWYKAERMGKEKRCGHKTQPGYLPEPYKPSCDILLLCFPSEPVEQADKACPTLSLNCWVDKG